MQDQEINLKDSGSSYVCNIDSPTDPTQQTSELLTPDGSAESTHCDATGHEKKEVPPEGDALSANTNKKRKRKRKPITQEQKLKEIERLRNYRKKAKEEKVKLMLMVKELQAKLSEPNDNCPDEHPTA